MCIINFFVEKTVFLYYTFVIHLPALCSKRNLRHLSNFPVEYPRKPGNWLRSKLQYKGWIGPDTDCVPCWRWWDWLNSPCRNALRTRLHTARQLNWTSPIGRSGRTCQQCLSTGYNIINYLNLFFCAKMLHWRSIFKNGDENRNYKIREQKHHGTS